MEHLKYPIGKFDPEKVILDSEIPHLVHQLKELPQQLKKVTKT